VKEKAQVLNMSVIPENAPQEEDQSSSSSMFSDESTHSKDSINYARILKKETRNMDNEILFQKFE
jgi:hypothetical protein